MTATRETPGMASASSSRALTLVSGAIVASPVTLPPWMREADHVAAFDWLRVGQEDDGYRRGRSLGRLSVDGTRHDDNIDLEPDKFLCQLAHSFRSSLCPSVFDRDVLAVDPTEFTEPAAEGFNGVRVHGRAVP